MIFNSILRHLIWPAAIIPAALVLFQLSLKPYHDMRWTVLYLLGGIGALYFVIGMEIAISQKKYWKEFFLFLLIALSVGYFSTSFFTYAFPKPYFDPSKMGSPQFWMIFHSYPLLGMIGYYFPWSIWVFGRTKNRLLSLFPVAMLIGAFAGLLVVADRPRWEDVAFYSVCAGITALIHWAILAALDRKSKKPE